MKRTRPDGHDRPVAIVRQATMLLALATASFYLGMAKGCTSTGDADRLTAAPRQFECRWANGSITIDGKADEPAWHIAQVIDSFRVPLASNRRTRPARTATRARLLWDRNYLYFFAEMEDADLYADVTEQDAKTWNNDVFELFFKPDDNKLAYYEFQVNAANTKFDAFMPSRGSGGFNRWRHAHELSVESAIVHEGTLNQWQDTDEGWSVEGRIPWSTFKMTGATPPEVAAAVWKFALCRYDYSVGFESPELSSCAPLNVLNFHRYEDYAPLHFIPPVRKSGPVGMNRRIPWNTSHLAGSPDPPLPFTVENAFPKLKWNHPLYIATEPQTGRVLIIERDEYKTGVVARISRISNKRRTKRVEMILEAEDRIIYGLTYHPDHKNNGIVYVFSNGPWQGRRGKGKNRISSYVVERQPPYRWNLDSQQIIIEWPSEGHDGGGMVFGHDGMLYISAGDGTSDSDRWLAGQDLGNLCSTIMRIDVENPDPGRHYSIPPDNPFISLEGAHPEIWAYGLRNPWRIAIDQKTGHIWAGNNGQDHRETAHLVRRGENYGWSVYEGSRPFYLTRQRGPTPIVKPTIEHPHSESRSLTGGVVYYNKKFPQLDGLYIYGDYSTGKIWAARHDGTHVTLHREIADTVLAITSFHVDPDGEILISDYAGGIYRLVPNTETPPSYDFPRYLSQTGLFNSVEDHQLHPAAIPYSVNAPAWADGAHVQRFMAVPGNLPVEYAPAKGWEFPNGTALGQTLSIDMEAGNSSSRKRIETRVLLRQQNEWVGYCYRWNMNQTDAVLIQALGQDRELTIKDAAAPDGVRKQKWRHLSRAECMTCHTREANYLLGLTELQMNRNHDYGSVVDNQLRTLEHIGLFAKPPRGPPQMLNRIVNPYDPNGDLEERARSYLHANCSHCHSTNGGGNSQMLLWFTTPRDNTGILAVRPMHDTFSIDNAMLVAPGDPERSIICERLGRRGDGQMPPLGSFEVDRRAVELFREWIGQLQPTRSFVREWKMNDLAPLLEKVYADRTFESGRTAYEDAGCNQCHRSERGGTGPDLKGVGTRLDPHQLLESIILPSKVIGPDYAQTQIETVEGDLIVGRVERENDRSLLIITPPPLQETIELDKNDIEHRRQSTLSNMPTGMLNVLEQKEVLDLLAYLIADGDANHPAFARSQSPAEQPRN